jgi:carbon storage regulator
MLVLSRKPNEAVILNDTVRVTVVGIKGDRVRLGIEAPRDVSVDRGEVYARKMQFVDVPFAAASAVCDETIDRGGVLVATADDTMR